jgi:catechol 2,3-dioxygenase-like lactoylglutathione lyase family enzyme
MNLSIDAVAVVAKDISKTLAFYEALGFVFTKY